MRSSIACVRCRRSKVKCLNNGINTPCRACSVAGRECVYPSPATGDRSHRGDASSGRMTRDSLGNADTPRSARSKPKKAIGTGIGGAQSNRALIDALDTHVLTQQVWVELFNIWQLHFALDLPFLHSTNFLSLLHQAKGAPAVQDFNTPPADAGNQLPNAPQELLLAFLTLTSRFHGTIVSHHSPGTANRPSNPALAANYYAAACREKLARLSDTPADLARVQAHLILAFHEWGNCQSVRAWNDLGEAIRCANLIGLNYQEDLEPNASKSWIIQPQISHLSITPKNTEDNCREQETRRRTFWACFILERCLSSGRYRPISIRVDDIKIQLPASDRAYLFNERVRTPLLAESMQDLHRLILEEKKVENNPQALHSPRSNHESEVAWESGPYEGLVSRYVKASEAYNAVVQWACRGGRLNERYVPWDTQSTWNILYKAVNQLIEKLPRDLALSQANISAHITSRTSAAFTQLHTMLLLSKIILHREFLPFLPFRATHAKGPIDSLSPFCIGLPPQDSPLSFWSDSASELFKSARDLLNLYLTCSEWKVLVETPLVGFASYMVASLGIYSAHFPWMDSKEWMSTNPAANKGTSGMVSLFIPRDCDYAKKACDLVAHMQPRLRLAEGWFKTLSRLHKVFYNTKRELRKHYKFTPFSATEPFQGKMHLHPLKMGDEHYEPLDKAFENEYNTAYQDTVMLDAPKEEPSQYIRNVEHTARESWAAVNALTATPSTQPSNGFNPNYHPGQQSPPTSSNQPSNYPPISPQAHSTQPYTPSQPQYTPYQPKSPPLPQPTSDTPQESPSRVKPPPNSQSWTAEQVEAWLDTLETVFGANDVAAFTEAVDWRDFAGPASTTRGWLRLVWTS